MSLDKKDFYGKEVTDAIRMACETLGVPQEQLEIEVIEPGSTGIFGLIRKKAHIRAQVKSEDTEIPVEFVEAEAPKPGKRPARKKKEVKEKEPPPPAEKVQVTEEKKEVEKVEEQPVEASPESLELVKNELLSIVELMGFPSTLEMEAKGLNVDCVLRGEFEENLTGVEGKTLDSLQYLVRKIVTRKVPERLKVTVDVGDFRKKRQEELKVRAVELAAMVKEDGKTQVIPALNPSERRVIHMILQEDKEIRSRSVGDGLFKKILIFKPGKGNKPGRKRSSSRGSRGKKSQNKKPANED